MEEITIRLREWQSLSPNLGSPTRGVFLPQDAATLTLVQNLSQRGILEIQEYRNGLYLKALSFVGFISIGGLRIVIEPKIQGMQLMRLLRYAYGLRNLQLLTRVLPSIGENSFVDLLIQQLLAECQELLSRGLHRRYTPVFERLSCPRGRLDIQALAREGIVTAELPCWFHPRIEDCLLNQVLLSGLRLAASITRDRELRSALRRTAGILEDSVSLIRLDLVVVGRLRQEMNRLTVAYEPAVSIVEILLNSSGVALQGTPQQPRLQGFMFDMNRFFQRLLGRFLRENITDCHVLEETSIKGMMAYSSKHNPRARRAPAPRPDYCIKRVDGTVLLLDAKYRDLWEEDLPRDMLYQLAIYALSQKTVGRSTILYPTMSEHAKDAVIHIYEPSSGNVRAEVVKRPVNLGRLAALLGESSGMEIVQQKYEFAEGLLSATS